MAKKSPSSASPATAPADSSQSFTSLKRVRELIALMTDHGLSEIELAEDKSRIVLRRGVSTAGASVASPLPVPAPAVHAPAAAPTTPAAADATLVAIKSPMVGTFYAAPSPDADPYISVGSTVDEKTTVCVIEAMKTFNQIHAEMRGTVAKVLVSNGQLIEYGQPLFMIKPN